MNKSAIITGSSGLIGSQMTKEFLAHGFKVYGFDLKDNPELTHPNYTFVSCDVSDEAQIRACFENMDELDVLINNASRAQPENTPLENMSLQEWNQTLSLNLTSYFLMSRAALPLLRYSKGCIINISSTRHHMSEPHTEIYTTAKGGINALTRALAITYAHQVRVNSISPGWIADPREERKPQDHQQHPVGRVGRPQDIASLALFLAGPEAGFITGQDFIVDGGMSVKMIYE